MITIVAKCQLKPGNKSAFIAGVENLIEKSRKEEGNISYDLFEDLNNENTVTFMESWKDEDAISFHNQSAHFQEGIQKIKELSEYIEINQYQKL